MRPLEELLAAYVRHGDEDAMQELVSRTRPRLLSRLRGIGDRADREDAAQNAYLALLRADPPRDVAAWLAVTSLRIAYRQLARRRRELEIAERLRLDRATPRTTDVDAEMIRAAVDRLPAPYRDAVVLHHLHGLETAEIARLLGVEPATVRTRLYRGRLLLKSRLGPRLAHGLWAIPWLCRDSSTWIGGGVLMSRKASAAIVLLSLLLVGTAGGLLARSGHDEDRARSASTDRTARDEEPQAPTPNAPPPAGPAADESKPPAIAGLVVDPTGTPLTGVSVFDSGARLTKEGGPIFLDARRSPPALATTDEEGRFTISTADGFDELAFVHPEHVAGSAPPKQEMRIVLERAQVIDATVRDTSGRPIEFASVAAMRTQGLGISPRGLTDAEGRVRLTSVPLDEGVKVFANGWGYEANIGVDAKPVMVFTLKRMGILLDVVDAASGSPLETATVLFVRHGARQTVSPAFDDSQQPSGWFECRPGQLYYTMYPENGADVVADAHVFAEGFRVHEEHLRWKAEEEPPHRTIRLQRGPTAPSLAGRVQPAVSARVELRLPWYPHDMEVHPCVRATTCDERGRFSFAGIPAGPFRIVAIAEGFGPAGVDVTAPDTNLTIPLSRAATLDLTARDATGAPVSGSWFHIESADRRRSWEVQTGEDGTVRAIGLTPGALLVAPLRARYSILPPAYDGPRADVSVASGRTGAVSMEVPIRRRITVRVQDAAGRPLEGLQVRVGARGGHAVYVRPDEKNVRGETNANGAYFIDAWPGEYEVEVRAGSANVRETILVAPDGPPEHDIVIANTGPILVGRVTSATTGRPVEGARVRVWTRAGVHGDATTDSGGRYRLRGSPAGRVRVIAWRPHELSAPEAYLETWRDFDMPGEGETTLDCALTAVTAPVPFLASVKEEGTGRVLDDIQLELRDLRDGWWIVCGQFRTDMHGKAEGKAQPCRDPVLFIAGGSQHKDQRIEPSALDRIEVALEKK